MNFFKKQSAKDPKPPSISEAQKQMFDQEWFAAVNRFFIVAGMGNSRFDLIHPETKEKMQPHEGLAGTLGDWVKIQSPWDRRRLLFDTILQTMWKSMKHWWIANILIANREPNKAIGLMKREPAPPADTEDYVYYCESYARVWQYLQQPQEALEWIQKAYSIANDNKIVRVRMADVLHMTGECDQAHEIYTSLMQSVKKGENPAGGTIKTMFEDIFALETGAVPSPVFAIDIGEKLSNPQQAAEFWQLGEIEFYDSPYFRMHHAYYYIAHKDLPRAIAKLIALIQEMPWLREATLNLDTLFKKVDPSGTQVMPELQKQIRETIQKQGWTADGMYEISIDLDK